MSSSARDRNRSPSFTAPEFVSDVDAGKFDRDVVIKVKYGDILKRFNARFAGSESDQKLAELREKIIAAFKFSPDADLILQYTDEDGDVVMLDDDDDLRDAACHQRLNPLRINVLLRGTGAEASEKPPISNSATQTTSSTPVSLVDQVKPVFDEAFKSLPDPLRDTALKFYQDLMSNVASSAPPPVAELMQSFCKLGSTSSNAQPTREPVGGASGPVSGASKQPVVERVGTVTAVPATSACGGIGHPRVGGELRYPSIGEIEALLAPQRDQDNTKEHNDKGRIPTSNGASPAAAPPTVPPMGIWSYAPPKLYPTPYPFDSTSKRRSDFKKHCPVTPFQLRGKQNIPYPGPTSIPGYSTRNLDGNQEGQAPAFHRWIQCDGCGMQPIVGPRYKSLVKHDYDLCSTCFLRMGKESDYTRIDFPVVPDRMMFADVNPWRRNSAYTAQCGRVRREKLEARFIQDVTVPDGTMVAPATPFTKIWRMRNNGPMVWPFGTKLIWVGGDQFALETEVQLQIPESGFRLDGEIDVAVDFTAPSRPGRYISYWTLSSPSGQKFGQHVWVLIQVEQPTRTDGESQIPINLNLPPASSADNGARPIEIDMNADIMDADFTPELPLYEVPMEESVPAESDILVMQPGAATPVPIPISELPLASSNATPAASVPAFIPINEPIIDLPPSPAPVHAPIIDLTAASSSSAATPVVSAPAPEPEPVNINKDVEEALLKQLEDMGFRQLNVNKEVLRKNKYDLEQSVEELCGFSEWDPLLAELQEMGFEDAEANRELLAKNGGSIKRAVIDLVAREKKDK